MDVEPAGATKKINSPAEAEEHSVTPQAVRGEVREFLRTHERRRRQLPRAALVGLLSGLVAIAFRWMLEEAAGVRNHLFADSHLHFSSAVLAILWCAVSAGASVWLVRRVAPETAGSGIPHLKTVLHRLRGLAWRRVLPVKFIAGVLAIGGGMALGREGPTIQMGGAIGQMVSKWLGATPRERQTLIAAGAGAGLAAAFNAPLAGLIFVLEEVQRDFSPIVFTAAFVAAVTADVVGRVLTGQLPIFHAPAYPTLPLTALPLFLVLGVVCGVLGVMFNRALLGCLGLFSRASSWPAGASGLLVGAGIGVVGWFAPEALGGGYGLAQNILAGHILLTAIPIFFLLRFALTIFSYGCGAPGGIFAPLLVLGAQIGLFVGLIAQHFFPHLIEHPQVFAVVGMAAYFAAIVRAPLTGIVLIVEMTASYAQMLPLLIACLTAYGVADLMGDLPIYEALLERDLLHSQEAPQLEGSLLLELPIYAGAKFEGQRVSDLALPSGCVLISIGRDFKEIVPLPETTLQAGDRLTAVIAPQAGDAAITLREGTEAPPYMRSQKDS